MNVIVANKYKELLMNLDIEVIKSLEGKFDVQTIIDNFSNFYFDRMILDITAIKGYHDVDNLQKLSAAFDMNRVVILLDDSEESTNPGYLSKLISIGIYNFTRNSDGIKYLMQNPNSYRDVVHLHHVNENESYNPVPSDNSIMNESTSRVIGIQSLTEGAGATTLTYMMKKALETAYSTCIIEVNKNDMHFFDDKDTTRTTNDELVKEIMKKHDCEVVLVDLNGYSDPDICTDVLYLIEPSTLKLNKLLTKDRKLSETHKNHKIVLVKSFIKNSEIKDFEYETKLNVYYNLPSLNEREENHEEINGLLRTMGFSRIKSNINNESKNKLLGMFKI